MRKSYLAFHDYQHGGVLVRVFAESLQDVQSIFEPPNWSVVAEGSEEAPEIPEGFKILESDIDNQEPWLKKFVYLFAREKEGKQAFYFETKSRPTRYWEVYARSNKEVREKLPQLKSVSVPITEKIFREAKICNIDSPTDFLELFDAP